MNLSVSYNTLFEVNLFHLYFLSKGNDSYLSMSIEDQENQLESYEASDFISITPTRETTSILSNYQLIFRIKNTGFQVLSRVYTTDKQNPFIAIDDDLKLEFLIKITDGLFSNYTDPVLETYDGLYYFSNLRLDTEAGSFPLIKLADSLQEIKGDYILGEDSKEKQMEKLSDTKSRNLFGILSISMKSVETALSVTDVSGKIQSTPTKFEILFGNRQTFWRYIFKEGQTVDVTDDVEIEETDPKILITEVAYPVTSKGFISVKLGSLELPNPNSDIIKPDSTIQYKAYSEIYM